MRALTALAEQDDDAAREDEQPGDSRDTPRIWASFFGSATGMTERVDIAFVAERFSGTLRRKPLA